ncbi:MAG: CoA transferase [bacterium]|tara:strand:- start:10400 stop:11320 length:921 start_codon:yes stop_codon:yes gene_type:complete
MKLLDGMLILDLSHRLPGPMAGKVLADLGAKVIKVEDEKFKDPFIQGLFAEMDPSFPHWYEELNSCKQILRIDFKSSEAKESLRELVAKADGIIMGLPPKVRIALGVDQESLEKLNRPLCHVELFSKRNLTRGMHDLNALADTGLLKLYVEGKSDEIVDPPFLPVAGISFGHKAATDLLAGLLKARAIGKTQFIESFLYESTEELLSPFWPKACREKGIMQTLHNGRYPCYSIYRLKDGKYAALAAVEEKFWQRFCESTGLQVEADLRFHFADRSVFNQVSAVFSKLTSTDVMALIEANDMCLSLV